MSGGSCGVCQGPAIQCCSGCHMVYYCSRDHQKQHWRIHKATCTPRLYHVSQSPSLGRYLIATQNIHPGDVIIVEKPLVIGPKVSSFPLCLGCHKRVVDKTSVCSRCNWPMCSKDCEELTNHNEECQLMHDNGYRASIMNYDKQEAAYCCITPLRCLLLKKNDKTKWKSFLTLESHIEERINTPLYKIFKNNVVGFIRNVVKLIEFDVETILNVCGVLDTNTFDIRLNNGEIRARGIYPTAAIMAHDCTPNTKHSFSTDSTITVRATVPIMKGEVISTTYTQTLWDTTTRRSHLKQSKCFDCSCKRCSDPTELGTYLGAFNCTKCSNNNNKSKIVSMDALDVEARWRCETCGYETPGREIAIWNDVLRKEIAALNKTSPEGMEKFLEKYEKRLHATNMHVVEVKYALTQFYGNMMVSDVSELSDNQLKRKVDLCQELLTKVAAPLDPGSSQLRGLLLWDLQEALVVQAGKLNQVPKQAILQQAHAHLKEATEILQHETDIKRKLTDKMASSTETQHITT